MAQRREGYFFVLEEDTNFNTRFEEHQDFIEVMKQREFIKIKTIEGNQFSTLFQDIWTNPEQTHHVYFVHDPVLNINYFRLHNVSNVSKEPKSIRKVGGIFSGYHYTELALAAEQEAIENGDEEEQAIAVFNFAVGFYVYDPRYPGLFEKYLQIPSVKVRLATIRAIGFQLWDECAPLLENVIQNDSNPAVRAYATETLRQIQQPDFDPDDLVEHPENYPNSLERVTEKGLMILPQIKDDLQAWMKQQGYLAMDALVLYQYLVESYGEFKPTESEPDTPTAKDSGDSSQPDTIEDQNESQQAQLKRLERVQQELESNKQKLTQLRTQLKKVEERIENARRTNIFGRPQSGENERERDKLTQEIKDVKNRIALDESAINASEE